MLMAEESQDNVANRFSNNEVDECKLTDYSTSFESSNHPIARSDQVSQDLDHLLQSLGELTKSLPNVTTDNVDSGRETSVTSRTTASSKLIMNGDNRCDELELANYITNVSCGISKAANMIRAKTDGGLPANAMPSYHPFPDVAKTRQLLMSRNVTTHNKQTCYVDPNGNIKKLDDGGMNHQKEEEIAKKPYHMLKNSQPFSYIYPKKYRSKSNTNQTPTIEQHIPFSQRIFPHSQSSTNIQLLKNAADGNVQRPASSMSNTTFRQNRSKSSTRELQSPGILRRAMSSCSDNLDTGNKRDKYVPERNAISRTTTPINSSDEDASRVWLHKQKQRVKERRFYEQKRYQRTLSDIKALEKNKSQSMNTHQTSSYISQTPTQENKTISELDTTSLSLSNNSSTRPSTKNTNIINDMVSDLSNYSDRHSSMRNVKCVDSQTQTPSLREYGKMSSMSEADYFQYQRTNLNRSRVSPLCFSDDEVTNNMMHHGIINIKQCNTKNMKNYDPRLEDVVSVKTATKEMSDTISKVSSSTYTSLHSSKFANNRVNVNSNYTDDDNVQFRSNVHNNNNNNLYETISSKDRSKCAKNATASNLRYSSTQQNNQLSTTTTEPTYTGGVTSSFQRGGWSMPQHTSDCREESRAKSSRCTDNTKRTSECHRRSTTSHSDLLRQYQEYNESSKTQRKNREQHLNEDDSDCPSKKRDKHKVKTRSTGTSSYKVNIRHDTDKDQNKICVGNEHHQHWYRPNLSREEAVNYLKNKGVGDFLVRDSLSYQGSYALAVNVGANASNNYSDSDSDATCSGNGTLGHQQNNPVGGDDKCIRHFLIESSAKGVKLKGYQNEPIFSSLSALIYQHTIRELALPVLLNLPSNFEFRNGNSGGVKSHHDTMDSRSSSNNKYSRVSRLDRTSFVISCKVWYLASYFVENISGPDAVRSSIEAFLNTNNIDSVGPRNVQVKLVDRGKNPTIAHIKITPKGLTLTDVTRQTFFRKHIPVESILYCGVDPYRRVWTPKPTSLSAGHDGDDDDMERRHEQRDLRMLCFVSSPLRITIKQDEDCVNRETCAANNICHVLAEFSSDRDSNVSAKMIANSVNKILV